MLLLSPVTIIPYLACATPIPWSGRLWHLEAAPKELDLNLVLCTVLLDVVATQRLWAITRTQVEQTSNERPFN